MAVFHGKALVPLGERSGVQAAVIERGSGGHLFEPFPRLKSHFQFVFAIFAAVQFGLHRGQQRLIAGAGLGKLRHVLVQHLDGGVNLPVQRAFMAQDFIQFVQALVFGQRLILKELGLPAVEATQTPGGGGDLFDIVTFEQVTRGDLGGELGFDLAVAFGVFAQAGEDDVPGEESVGRGIAGADGFALGRAWPTGLCLPGSRCLFRRGKYPFESGGAIASAMFAAWGAGVAKRVHRCEFLPKIYLSTIIAYMGTNVKWRRFGGMFGIMLYAEWEPTPAR